MLFSRVFSLLALLVTVSAQLNRPTIYLLRHGEKPEDPENHFLSADGYKRTECLRSVFGKDSPYNIGYILAPRVKWSKHPAPCTLHPLAQLH